MKKKVIIGIHGLGNKPREALLHQWWLQSLEDGLRQIITKTPKINLEMVYWADHNYLDPLNEQVSDPENELFISEPYVSPASVEGLKEKKVKKKFLDFFEKELDSIFLKNGKFTGIDKLVDATVKSIFKDLDNYYHGYGDNQKERLSGQELRNRLHDVLQKYQGYEIMLIGHSMGTIIAYDTLLKYQHEIKINTLATIGSPLGLSVILKKIFWDNGIDITEDVLAPTPDNITKAWYNFSDIDDKIAINYNLADDYDENAQGVKPWDFVVINDYVMDGVRNPHKGYGYLRTKELAEKVLEFLQK